MIEYRAVILIVILVVSILSIGGAMLLVHSANSVTRVLVGFVLALAWIAVFVIVSNHMLELNWRIVP